MVKSHWIVQKKGLHISLFMLKQQKKYWHPYLLFKSYIIIFFTNHYLRNRAEKLYTLPFDIWHSDPKWLIMFINSLGLEFILVYGFWCVLYYKWSKVVKKMHWSQKKLLWNQVSCYLFYSLQNYTDKEGAIYSSKFFNLIILILRRKIGPSRFKFDIFLHLHCLCKYLKISQILQ